MQEEKKKRRGYATKEAQAAADKRWAENEKSNGYVVVNLVLLLVLVMKTVLGWQRAKLVMLSKQVNYMQYVVLWN